MEIAVYFDNLKLDQVQNFTQGLFGIYTNASSDTATRQNVAYLLPLIWQRVAEETRQGFGLKYAQFTANNYQSEKRAAKEFLQIVSAESYIPDELRVVEVENAIEDLLVAHNGMNNFYSEVTFAKQLRRVVGEHSKVPQKLQKKYIYALVNVFITNAHGVATGAEPVYLELIDNLKPTQAAFAVISFWEDNQIASKLQFSLCERKYRQLLDLVDPKIISEPVKDLLKEIKKTASGGMGSLKNNPNISREIGNLRTLLK